MAEAFAELGVTWFEEPVSSDDLDGLRLLRDRAPAGMDIAAGEYGYDLFYFRRMLDAGAVDVLQADATRCGGITGFLARRRALRGARAAALGPLRPVAARASELRAAGVPPPGVLPRPRPDRAHVLRRRPDPGRRRPAARPGPPRAGPGVQAAGRRPGTPSEPSPVRARLKSPEDDIMTSLVGHATATNPQQRHRKEARGSRCSSTPSALARELRAAIAGEVRFDDGSRALYATDGSNYRQVPIGVVVPRERGRRDRDRSTSAAGTARRSSRAAAARAWPAAAATSPS